MNKPPALAVVATIRSALSFSYVNIGFLAKLSAIWLALFALFTLFFQFLGMDTYLELVDAVAYVTANPSAARAEGYESLEVLTEKLTTITGELGIIIPIHYWLDKIVRVIIYASIAVAILRSYLQDKAPPLIRLGKIEARMIKYLTLYIAILVGIDAAVYAYYDVASMENFRAGIFTVFAPAILLFMIARFLMVFPSIALGDASMSLKKSWLITRKNSWRLYGGLLLVLLSSSPLSIVKFIIGELNITMFVAWTGQLFCSLLVLMYLLTFLAICYQLFTPSDEKDA